MFQRPVKERFIVLAISSDHIMDVETNRIMIKTIESYKPSYWRLHNLDNYIVYYRFKSKESADRASKLYQEVVDLIIDNSIFEHFKIGINEGMLISDLNLFGEVTFEQLGGEAVNEAYKLQKGKSELIKNA